MELHDHQSTPRATYDAALYPLEVSILAVRHVHQHVLRIGLGPEQCYQ